MTRILVTGGAGYVGAVSVEAFLEAGHEVVVLDDLSTGHRSAVPDGARLIVGDYTDRATAAAVFAEESIDAILHCAARSLIGESIVQPARYFGDNVGGGVGFLEAARNAGVMRFVLSSSAAVYGVPDTTPILEDAPLRIAAPAGDGRADRARAAVCDGPLEHRAAVAVADRRGAQRRGRGPAAARRCAKLPNRFQPTWPRRRSTSRGRSRVIPWKAPH